MPNVYSKMTSPINYKIDAIINILYKYEDHLSDGFGYYCRPKFSSSDEMLKAIATDILSINKSLDEPKSVDEAKTIDENKWFRMAYYGNGKPEDIIKMAYYGNGKPEDIEEFLLKINKPLQNKIFNKKWHPKTALEIAVYNGNYKYVRDLIKLGATVTLKAVKLCERLCENIREGHILKTMLQELTYNIDYNVYKKYYTKNCWLDIKDVHVMNIVENVRDHLTTLKTHRRNYKNGEYEKTFEILADAMNRIKNIK